jgi:aryl-alcohol dehydrogenase-like predicted oxidoreductase
LHRIDKSVPIEDTIGELARLLKEGAIGAIGLSEVAPDTLRRAHDVHPIAAVQSEYSLWTRNPELGLIQACAELGAILVAFSPLARGLFERPAAEREELRRKGFPPRQSALPEPRLAAQSRPARGFSRTR